MPQENKRVPLYFLPPLSGFVCKCGHNTCEITRVLGEKHQFYIVVCCMNTQCDQYDINKRIDLPQFTNYVVVKSE